MSRATLVIMAAGLGSRFGGGIKQLAPVGPGGEIIMDYSICDAVEAGFDKVVFVIRKDLEEDFRKAIGDRIGSYVETAYAYQEVENLPESYVGKFPERTKPWGTGQAVLCCREVVDSPFLVINADDYYGKEAYREAYRYLTEDREQTEGQMCMVAFTLKNTLSENGGVTRGLCQVGPDGMLEKVVETREIEKREGVPVLDQEGEIRRLDPEALVSMNMWGFFPDFFETLEREFKRFLSSIEEGDKNAEYLLPVLIGQLLEDGGAQVRVLHSPDEWFGVTYKEDRQLVVEKINQLVQDGVYQRTLYEKGV